MQPVNNLSMTEAELQWAWEIKDAILRSCSQRSSSTDDCPSEPLDQDQDQDQDQQQLAPITDYEIAQLAVVTLGLEDLDSVLERVFQLQCFREEYRLDDSAEEGVELMQYLIQEQQPGHILAFDRAPDNQSFVGVFDFAANKPSAVDLPNDWRIYLGAYYYLLSAACANLTATREGFVTIIECDGMSYQTFSHKMQQRWAQELGMHYPVQDKESLWLNTPMVGKYLYVSVYMYMHVDVDMYIYLLMMMTSSSHTHSFVDSLLLKKPMSCVLL